MSVTERSFIRRRRFTGFMDPRFPIGFWWGAGESTGDGSGGFLRHALDFAGVSIRDAQLYSLEQIDQLRSSSTSAGDFEILTDGFDDLDRTGTDWDMVVQAIQPGSSAILLGATRDLSALRGYFLGNPAISSPPANLSVAVTNVNLATLRIRAQGYIWDPRSILADGGPQRPPTGLYPH